MEETKKVINGYKVKVRRYLKPDGEAVCAEITIDQPLQTLIKQFIIGETVNINFGIGNNLLQYTRYKIKNVLKSCIDQTYNYLFLFFTEGIVKDRKMVIELENIMSYNDLISVFSTSLKNMISQMKQLSTNEAVSFEIKLSQEIEAWGEDVWAMS